MMTPYKIPRHEKFAREPFVSRTWENWQIAGATAVAIFLIAVTLSYVFV